MELELADPADDPARPVALGGAMRLRPGPPPIAKRDRRSGGSRAKRTRSVATVSYNSPGFLAERHHLEGALRAPFDAVESIVEALLGA
jgi:hypothetical protein